jgi:hypothetical protein
MEPPMLSDLASAFARSGKTLAADFAGTASLVILFVAALHLPGIL